VPPTLIAIAGNIGAGKTELTSFLASRYGAQPSYEPDRENPYLADFYRDMKRWAFRSQLFFLTHKFRLHRELEQGTGTVIQDRTIHEDAEIFARNLRNQRAIDARDWELFQALYRTMAGVLRPPDLLIYLRCPPRALRARIRRRGRAMEQALPARYLARLGRLYEAWFADYRLGPKLVVATDQLDYLTNLVDRADLLRQIEQHL
jgi:deoxyadenosine/deoxycytidine kinase